MKSSVLRLGGLCSGIGGMEYAFAAAGFDVRWLVEINPFCRRVLEHHQAECWPHARIHEDVFHVGRHNLSAVDVITAGFPCQPFSTAGRRRGTADERFIWPEIWRVIQELKPVVVLLENVAGLRTNDCGRTFKRILWQLNEGGFDAEWAHLKAADIGAPHLRERLFIVAYARRQRHPEQEAGNATSDKERNDTARQCRGQTELHAVESSGQAVGDAAGSREEAVQPVQCQSQSAGYVMGDARQPGGPTQSGMGIDVNGLSGRLVRHRWPAGQGDFQYRDEPPRTTKEVRNRRDGVEAVGNAVVPQVVYPIAVAIREWLEAPANGQHLSG